MVSAVVCKSVNYRVHRAADTTNESSVPKQYFNIDGKDIDSDTIYETLLSIGATTSNPDRRVVRANPQNPLGVYTGDVKNLDLLAALKLVLGMTAQRHDLREKDLLPIKPVYDTPLDVNGP